MADSDIHDLTSRVQTFLERQIETLSESSSEADYIKMLSRFRALRSLAVQVDESNGDSEFVAALRTMLREMER